MTEYGKTKIRVKGGIVLKHLIGFILALVCFSFAMISPAEAAYFPLQSGGNVGIGTTAPVGSLLFVGSGGTLNNVGTGDVYIQNDLEVDGTIYGNGAGITGLSASNIAYSGITAPTKIHGIDFAGYTNTWTSTLDTGVVFLIDNTDADLAADTVLMRLEYTDDGDANAIFLQARDNNADLKFEIGNEGNVGIGATAPNLLHLQSTVPGISFFDTDVAIGGANPAWRIRSIDEGGALRFQTTTDYSSYTDRMSILSNGNVGIGMTAPPNLLHLQSTVPGISFFDTDIAIGSANPAWRVRSMSDDGAMRFQTTTDYSSYTDRALILPNGNVGIGTTAPEKLLEVQGAEATDADLVLDADDGDDAADTWFVRSTAADNKLRILNDTNVRMTVQSDGNVGIGMTAPVVLLHVGSAGTLNSVGTGDVYIQNDLEVDGTLYAGSLSLAIDGLTDAYTDYATDHNIIMGRASAAALTSGAQYNTFIGEGAGATSGNSTATTDHNTAVGYTALVNLTSGSRNTALGAGALFYNDSGTDNTGIGRNALGNNTTGQNNIAMGEGALAGNTTKRESTAIGYASMLYADSAVGGAVTYNTAVGAYSLQGSTTAANNTGTYNTVVGHSALAANTSGSANTAVGVLALNANTSGENNTALGKFALKVATTSDNTAIGSNSLAATTSGADNTAVGSDTLTSNVTGNKNTAMGYQALYANVDKRESTALGYWAMRYADSGAAAITYNTAVGAFALQGSATPANNTGTNNTVVGHSALIANTSGEYNTVVGVNALGVNTTGSYNVAVGASALYSNTGGNRNTAVGEGALFSGGNNTDDNTAIGKSALELVNGSDFNVAVGSRAGDSITSGASNILIGYGVDVPTASTSNYMSLGNLVFGVGIGATGIEISTGNVGVGTTAPEGKLEVQAVEATNADLVLDADDGDDAADTWFIRSTAADNKLRILNDTNVRMTVQSDGNVGIGMTAPVVLLHVGSAGTLNNVGTGDVYIQNDLEVDGTIYGNGAGITGLSASNIPYSGITAPTKIHGINFAGYTNTWTSTLDTGVVFLIDNTDADLAADTVLMRLEYTDDGDANAIFLQARDNNADLKFEIGNEGNVGIGMTALNGKLMVRGAGTTTGINFQTQNSSGTPLVTMMDNGNIGIGTTSPSMPFEIVGSSSSDLVRIRNTNTSGFSSLDILSDGGNDVATFGYGNSTAASNLGAAYIWTDSTTEFRFSVGNALTLPTAIIKTNGNVGIGVTDPSGNLGIGSTSSYAQLSLRRVDTTIVAAEEIGRIDFMGDDGAVNQAGARIAAAATAAWSGSSGDHPAELRFYTEADGATQDMTSPRMVINDDGNVGIGLTASISSKLYVNATSGTGLTALGFGGEAAFFQAAANSTTSPTVAIRAETSPTTHLLEFQNNAGTAINVVNPQFNVGIGTSAPEGLLEVQGAEATNSNVILDADDGDDAADTWFLRSVAGNNNLDVLNDTNVRFSIASGGNVGIGLSTPQVLLHVGTGGTLTNVGAGDAYIQNDLEVDGTIYGNGAGITGLSASNIAYSGITAPTKIHGIDFAGYTNTWTSTLDTGVVFLIDNTDADLAADTVLMRLEYTDDGDANAIFLQARDNNADLKFEIGNEGNVGIGMTALGGRLMSRGLGTTTGVNFQTQNSSGTPLITALDNGNVGIGTTGPTKLFHLQQANTTDGILLNMNNSSATPVGSWIHLNGGGGSDWDVGQDGLGFGLFSGSNRRFTVQTGGNVGIGTTVPGVLLHVGTGGTLTNVGAGDVYIENDLEVDGTLYAGSLSLAIDGLTDAYTDYATDHNIIMGRASAAALTSGAQYNTFIGEGAGATSGNSTSATDGNIAIGYSALTATTTGSNNIAVGLRTLSANTTGYSNVAIGTSSLQSNVAKRESTAVGFEAMRYADSTGTGAVTSNTALGAYALRGSTTAANNTGTNNTAVGHSALRLNTSGQENTAVGVTAMDVNTTGQLNTAIGFNAMFFNDTGNSNTAVGNGALTTNVAKSQSTAIGYYAMHYADNGAAATTYNTAVGAYALQGSATPANNTGAQNTAVGHRAMRDNTTGDDTVAVGVQSLDANTTGDANSSLGAYSLISNTVGSNNTAVGTQTLYTNVGKNESTAVGYFAMRYADSAAGSVTTYNTALGAYALRGSTTAANNTGTSNTAVGHSVLSGNTAGAENTALGDRALQNSTTADGNTAIGKSALNSNDTADFNTGLGAYALYAANGAGANNTAVGYQAGNSITTGSANILIGYDVDAPTATTSNYMSLGNLVFGVGIGATGVEISTGNVGVGTTAPEGKLEVQAVEATNADLVLDADDGDDAADTWFIRSTAADNQLKFLNDTNERMVITSGGNVGVGFTNPAVLLHVGTGGTLNNVGTGDVYIQNDLEVDGTIYGNGAGITGLSASSIAYSGITAPTKIHGIDFAGYTNTWTSSLDTGTVFKIDNTDADLAADTVLLDLEYTDDGDANAIFLQAHDNNGDLKYQIGADGVVTMVASDGDTGTLSYVTSDGFSFQSGNVGIGTTALGSYNLNVTGTTYISGGLDVGGTGGGILNAVVDQGASSGFRNVADFGRNAGAYNGFSIGYMADGSTDTAPAITSSGATDADLVIATESATVVVERMRIKSGGNVGIGTTGPTNLLHVTDAIRASKLVVGDSGNEISEVATNGNTAIYVNYDGYNGGTTQFRDLWVGDGKNTNVMFVDGSAASVGIGTTAPSGFLDISAGTSGDALVYIRADTDNNNEGDNPGIIFSQDGDTNTGFVRMEGNGGTYVAGTHNNSLLLGADSVDFVTLGVLRMSIDNNGLVGIGASTPEGLLEVQGAEATNADLVLDADDGDDAADTWFIRSTAADNQLKFLNDTNQRMVISSGGNVGIGTSTPGQLLDVAGQIQLDIDTTNDTTIGVCKNTTDGTSTGTEFRECNGTPGDIAEWYETNEGVAAGDIVYLTEEIFTYQEELINPRTGLPMVKEGVQPDEHGNFRHEDKVKVERNFSILNKATAETLERAIGIVSTSPYQSFGKGVFVGQNPQPIALIGRVPTNVSLENGPIQVGDMITISSQPGIGMKAAAAGRVIGYALEPFSGLDGKDRGQIMVFINPHWWGGPDGLKADEIQHIKQRLDALEEQNKLLRELLQTSTTPGV